MMIERAEILAGADPARAEQGYRDAVELAAAQGARAGPESRAGAREASDFGRPPYGSP
jgi:hypothetical protein